MLRMAGASLRSRAHTRANEPRKRPARGQVSEGPEHAEHAGVSGASEVGKVDRVEGVAGALHTDRLLHHIASI